MRKKVVFKKRKESVDPKFGDLLVDKFVRKMMLDGKKTAAYKIIYGALEIISPEKEKCLSVFKQAIENAKPTVETKGRRIGGAMIQIPTEVRDSRSLSLAIRWLIGSARERSEKTMKERLAAELIAASQNEGKTIKKKEDKQKMAKSNTVFASLIF